MRVDDPGSLPPVRLRMKPTGLAGLALVVLAMSCSDAVGPGGEIKDFVRARQRWQAQSLRPPDHTSDLALTLLGPHHAGGSVRASEPFGRRETSYRRATSAHRPGCRGER